MSSKGIVGAVVGLVVVAALVYMVIRPVSVFGITGEGLARSITSELESEPQEPMMLECVKRAEGVFRCTGQRFGEIDVGAEVDVDDDGCWVINASFAGAFRGRTGCISLFDATGAL